MYNVSNKDFRREIIAAARRTKAYQSLPEKHRKDWENFAAGIASRVLEQNDWTIVDGSRDCKEQK